MTRNTWLRNQEGAKLWPVFCIQSEPETCRGGWVLLTRLSPLTPPAAWKAAGLPHTPCPWQNTEFQSRREMTGFQAAPSPAQVP